MWWFIIVGFWLLLVIFGRTGIALSKKWDNMDREGIPDSDPKKKLVDRSWKTFLTIAIIIFCIPILYVIGWLWYFFCGGFLMWVDDAWYMKIVYGFISLIFLSILIGLFAILFGGWKPFK